VADYRAIITECNARTFPSHDAPVAVTLQPGTIVRVIRDDDAGFFRAAIDGQPLCVPGKCAVPSSEDAFLTQQASRPETPSAAQPADSAEGSAAGFADRLGAFIGDAILSNVVLFGATIALYGAGTSEGVRALATFAVAVGILAYYVYFNANGGTWGKRLIGLRIVNEKTGATPGIGRAIVRQIVTVASALPLYLGYLWMIWDKRKRTWHDMAAGTIVVRSSWHSTDSAKE
jgi:uncharacterized RDD family membrane protein YckC